MALAIGILSRCVRYSLAVQSARPLSTATDDFSTIGRPLSGDIQQKLSQPLDPKLIGIKPDGALFLSQHHYRRILNDAFGIGGWAIVPRGPVATLDDEVHREYALVAHGQLLSQAVGDHARLPHLSLGTTIESSRSNALVRCCKDLGLASVLWDPDFVRAWRAEHAVHVWCVNTKTNEKRQLWRLKDASFPWPWKESDAPSTTTTSFSSSSSPSSSSSSSSSSAAAAGPTPGSTQTFIGAPPPLPDQFDPEQPVPPAFKKVAGTPWIEVLSKPEGRKYLSWCAERDPPMGPLARRALDFWEASHHDEYIGV